MGHGNSVNKCRRCNLYTEERNEIFKFTVCAVRAQEARPGSAAAARIILLAPATARLLLNATYVEVVGGRPATNRPTDRPIHPE